MMLEQPHSIDSMSREKKKKKGGGPDDMREASATARLNVELDGL